MVVAFVLVSTKPGLEKDVYEHLSTIPEINEFYPVFGEYDLIIKLDAVNSDIIGNIIMNKIRVVDGIMETKTFMGVSL